jgi:hypothetical protein
VRQVLDHLAPVVSFQVDPGTHVARLCNFHIHSDGHENAMLGLVVLVKVDRFTPIASSSSIRGHTPRRAMTDQSTLSRFRSWLVTCILEVLIIVLLAASVFFFIGAEEQIEAHRKAGLRSDRSTP